MSNKNKKTNKSNNWAQPQQKETRQRGKGKSTEPSDEDGKRVKMLSPFPLSSLCSVIFPCPFDAQLWVKARCACTSWLREKEKGEQQQEQEDHSEGLADLVHVSLPPLHRGVCVQAERTREKQKRGVEEWVCCVVLLGW